MVNESWLKKEIKANPRKRLLICVWCNFENTNSLKFDILLVSEIEDSMKENARKMQPRAVKKIFFSCIFKMINIANIST